MSKASDVRQTETCNAHSCDPRLLPDCHGEHVHCAVKERNVDMSNPVTYWASRPGAATNECHRAYRYAYGNCHHCDTPAERALKGIHKTLVVTHEHKFQTQHCGKLKAFDTDNTRVCQHEDGRARAPDVVAAIDKTNFFHCYFKHNQNSCFCTCSHHPACAARQGTTVRNKALLGNDWHGVDNRQECCNMCTNHPKCDTFTFVDAAIEADRRCVLYAGSPKWKLIAPDDATYKTTYSGCQSGISEADC